MIPRCTSLALSLSLGASVGACTLDTTGQGLLGAGGPGLDASVEAAADAAADVSWPDSLDTSQPDVAPDTAAADAANADAADGSPDGGCVPETDVAFCTRYGKDCGTFTDDDNCAASRTADCGACATGTTCGGAGVANVCDWWWACEWTTRRRVTVTAQVAIPRNYSVAIQFDHAALVNAGRSLPPGDDVRVVTWDGFGWVEVDRVLDPDSAWNAADTTVWFATQAPMGAGEAVDYYVFTGNAAATAPPAQEGAVFHFADFFERPDSTTPDNGWIMWEDGNTNVEVKAGALWFDTLDQNNRPVADRPFPSIDDGLEWRFGFDWSRIDTEGYYRLHMQLGNGVVMENPPSATDYFSRAGVGPSLLWAGPSNGMTDHEGFGYEVAGTVTQTTIMKGKHRVRVVVAFASKTFSIEVDGATVATAVPFSSDLGSVDRLRLLSWQINTVYFDRRAFDYVLVRRRLVPEPLVTLDSFEDGSCP